MVENLQNLEFAGKDDSIEDSSVVAQRFLNLFRQIHIFTTERKKSFDEAILAQPPEIRGTFGKLLGGSLLQEYVDELEKRTGNVSFRQETVDEVAVPTSAASNIPLSDVNRGSDKRTEQMLAKVLESTQKNAQASTQSQMQFQVQLLEAVKKMPSQVQQISTPSGTATAVANIDNSKIEEAISSIVKSQAELIANATKNQAELIASATKSQTEQLSRAISASLRESYDYSTQSIIEVLKLMNRDSLETLKESFRLYSNNNTPIILSNYNVSGANPSAIQSNNNEHISNNPAKEIVYDKAPTQFYYEAYDSTNTKPEQKPIVQDVEPKIEVAEPKYEKEEAREESFESKVSSPSNSNVFVNSQANRNEDFQPKKKKKNKKKNKNIENFLLNSVVENKNSNIEAVDNENMTDFSPDDDIFLDDFHDIEIKEEQGFFDSFTDNKSETVFEQKPQDEDISINNLFDDIETVAIEEEPAKETRRAKFKKENLIDNTPYETDNVNPFESIKIEQPIVEDTSIEEISNSVSDNWEWVEEESINSVEHKLPVFEQPSSKDAIDTNDKEETWEYAKEEGGVAEEEYEWEYVEEGEDGSEDGEWEWVEETDEDAATTEEDGEWEWEYEEVAEEETLVDKEPITFENEFLEPDGKDDKKPTPISSDGVIDKESIFRFDEFEAQRATEVQKYQIEDLKINSNESVNDNKYLEDYWNLEEPNSAELLNIGEDFGDLDISNDSSLIDELEALDTGLVNNNDVNDDFDKIYTAK